APPSSRRWLLPTPPPPTETRRLRPCPCSAAPRDRSRDERRGPTAPRAPVAGPLEGPELPGGSGAEPWDRAVRPVAFDRSGPGRRAGPHRTVPARKPPAARIAGGLPRLRQGAAQPGGR